MSRRNLSGQSAYNYNNKMMFTEIYRKLKSYFDIEINYQQYLIN